MLGPRPDHLPTNVKNLVYQSLSFLQCCVKNWCIVFFVLQYDRLKMALGAIYLHYISVSEAFVVYFDQCLGAHSKRWSKCAF